MYLQRRGNKYGAKSHTYNGHTYHSKKEAAYAQELDLRLHVIGNERLERWERQVPIDLVVNGQEICTYTIDFVEYDTRGNIMYTEIKGFETPDWRLKWKLFDALHPNGKSKLSNEP